MEAAITDKTPHNANMKGKQQQLRLRKQQDQNPTWNISSDRSQAWVTDFNNKEFILTPNERFFFFHARGKQAQYVYAKRRVMLSRAKEINNLRVNIYIDFIFLYLLCYFVFPVKLHETLYIQFFKNFNRIFFVMPLLILFKFYVIYSTLGWLVYCKTYVVVYSI